VDPISDSANNTYAWGRSVQLLPAGTYKLSVKTDDSIAYDDWGSDGPPSEPDAYGLAVYPFTR
jgi:hypothetical protein